MAKKGPFDVILLNGDFNPHDMANRKPPIGNWTVEEHYIATKEIMTDLFKNYLWKHFPKTIFIPAIGNNDARYHYSYETDPEMKRDYL